MVILVKEEKKKKRKQPLVSDEPMDVDMTLLSPSFKGTKKNDRDEIIASFNLDKTIPVDKNNIQEVLDNETKKFKEYPEEKKKVVKKEIELELLYNYDTTSYQPTPKSYKRRIILDIILIVIGLGLIFLFFIQK